MARLTTSLLFAATAAAKASNITTTAWMTKFAGSDKFGYVASVMGADAEHTTLSLDFDADTNKTALHIGGEGGNYTFGASSYTVNWPMTMFEPTPSDADINVQIQCTQSAQSDDEVQCTGVLGNGYARFARCNEYQTTQTGRPLLQDSSTVYPHTYGTGLWGSGGVETVTMNLTYPLQTETTTPAWCTDDEVPASILTIDAPSPVESFAVYQIVITAGQEKLSTYSGTVSATGTPSKSASAGSGVTSARPIVTETPESTGAAGKINSIVPALAGIGVAAVMGML